MKKWFDEATIYQVYPKSFKDTNNDGIGDLPGVIEKLDYLKDLGINTLWLNPVYISPQLDNGYDVSNYFAIDPSLGTMDDMQRLIHLAHQHQMKIVMDFVMNHTSDQHPWFKDAVNNPDSIYRDYYLWAKGRNGGKPNNWGSFFGGSVWEKDPGQTNEYYFHLFDKHMPDLNWKNPEVQNSMIDIAKFWVKKGIDGLRLDAFIHISKADFEQDYPSDGKNPYPLAESFYANRKDVQDYLNHFSSELKKINPDIFIMGEASSANVNLAVDYSDPERQLCDSVITFRNFADDRSQNNHDIPENFQPAPIDVPGFREKMAVWQSNLEGISYPTLYWSNHDMARLATRYGDFDEEEASCKALALAMYLQKGLPIIYYGEELGMRNMNLQDLADFDDLTVPEFDQKATKAGFSHEEVLNMLNKTHKISARNAMQWDESNKYFGFSDHEPWKYGPTAACSVEEEQQEPNSVLNFYKLIIKMKQEPLYIKGREIVLNTKDKQVFGYKRIFNDHAAIVLCNLNKQATKVTLDDNLNDYDIRLIQKTANLDGKHQVSLAGWSSIVLEKK